MAANSQCQPPAQPAALGCGWQQAACPAAAPCRRQKPVPDELHFSACLASGGIQLLQQFGGAEELSPGQSHLGQGFHLEFSEA